MGSFPVLAGLATEAHPATSRREICFLETPVSPFRDADLLHQSSLPAASPCSREFWPSISMSQPDGELLALRSMDAGMKK